MKYHCSNCDKDVYSKTCPYCKTDVTRDFVKKFYSPIARQHFCPFCNHEIALLAGYCDCGWKIDAKSTMAKKIPLYLWDAIFPFISEYRYLKDTGSIKSGYEYFKRKVGETKFGKLVVTKVEHGYTKAEYEQRRLIGLSNNTMPDDWS